jgi:hypothetical protein
MQERLTAKEAYDLLSDLCVGLGFCLSPDENERLIATPPAEPEAFAKAVFLAERLDPSSDEALYQQVLERVIKAFDRHKSESKK